MGKLIKLLNILISEVNRYCYFLRYPIYSSSTFKDLLRVEV